MVPYQIICERNYKGIAQYLDNKGDVRESTTYVHLDHSKIQCESIGWHRESFYGMGMEHATNIWIPIKELIQKCIKVHSRKRLDRWSRYQQNN